MAVNRNNTGYPDGYKSMEGTPIVPPGVRALLLSDAVRRSSQEYGAGGGDAAVAERIQRTGINIVRFPDVFSQPEGAAPVFITVPKTLCPIGFSGGTGWTEILNYQVNANRKLIVVDAWVGFTNVFVSQIASAMFYEDGIPVPYPVRVLYRCGCDPAQRAIIQGTKTLSLQIKRDANTAGWDYGFFHAFVRGWDVPDASALDERMYK